MKQLIQFSMRNKLFVTLVVIGIIAFGLRGLSRISIGAVPDVTNNQLQIITTSKSLATEDVEKYLTLPVELEIANLPGVKEIRSISKFGLSVVTVVFDENLGTYLPRQLVAERLPEIQNRIPEGFGTPFIGPITTGLGELLQYTLEVEPGYEYSLTDLRTIQDWVVVRKLSGIEGVVEVNTWGGYLKQIEVAVIPERLQAYRISLEEVYSALIANNSIASGAYIEKNSEAYFIRADGQFSSTEAIGDVLVTYKDHTPVFIRDLAKVQIGHAPRYGAVTANGGGERVMGQLMLLKGAGESQTLKNIEQRFEEIANQLPEGVRINPFLDRSELVAKTSFTVAENLILGCLIVIFVIVILLGNWRSGVVVASVIPLSLLFALGMMDVFGVDANLMSLGAIDFGIIIDGAVIIVDFVTFYLVSRQKQLAHLPADEYQSSVDDLVTEGTYKMMHSAVFGQLIILLVFIPIFTLSGVEGKMFIPMAKVFSFALIGAMILCFTYIPVISSWVIRPVNNSFSKFSDQLFGRIRRLYWPILAIALRNARVVFAMALSMLIAAGVLFSKMGGEFAPTLDEGDFVIQPVLQTGTSLSKTIEFTTIIEATLLEFPEVKQVVSRIGAAEVPTDPMSMEESDVIIKLHPKGTWTTAETKDDLAEAFKSRIAEVLPAVPIEFTQPIEMRFNELITGVRTDLAIKLFGEDLSILADKAAEIARSIEDIPGASDISLEKVEGLPQIKITYNTNALAAYGLSVTAVNQMISTAYAGRESGVFYEGDRAFDIVLRYQEDVRDDLDQLSSLTLVTPEGSLIPISAVALIESIASPAKISRDNGNRRVVVGVNVRNRDLGSVVKDVQQRLNAEISLPPGYHIEYGGQFENLASASGRLMIAVPISLILIFIMLYLAFRSFKEALLIFTAIPIAAVGGIFFLSIRELPFSISAGVGFIALFGIAVLNGIVLIEELKRLEESGMKSVLRRVVTATQSRVRPVLLTAFAAALGFLPMAISESSGAEVQRPLATVVIGGLITATLLTLIVLPTLYVIVNRVKITPKPLTLVLLAFLSISSLQAQDQNGVDIQLAQLLERALEHHPKIKAQEKVLIGSKAELQSALNLPKTEVYRNVDQNNITEKGSVLEIVGVSQNFSFPTVYLARKKWLSTAYQKEEWNAWLNRNQALFEVSEAYYRWLVYNELTLLNEQRVETFQEYVRIAKLRIEVGESTELELLNAQTALQKAQNDWIEYQSIAQRAISDLKRYTALEDWSATNGTLIREPLPEEIDRESLRALVEAEIAVFESQWKMVKQEFAPEVSLDVFRGVDPADQKVYDGIQVGVALPIFYQTQKAKSLKAKTSYEASKILLDDRLIQKLDEIEVTWSLLQQEKTWMDRYENEMKLTFEAVMRIGLKSYQSGNLSSIEFSEVLNSAYELKVQYLNRFLSYHNHLLQLKYLTI